jgi:hypothetical protein
MRIMLVYQAGIANVFKVDSFNLADYGRDALMIYQGDFRGAIMFAHGAGYAGAIVRTAGCNMAGDIEHQKWTQDFDLLPFSDQFTIVEEN